VLRAKAYIEEDKEQSKQREEDEDTLEAKTLSPQDTSTDTRTQLCRVGWAGSPPVEEDS